MPSPELTSPVVLTADQVGSRRAGDRVPAALDALTAVPQPRPLRGFARTAGDEIQALFDDSRAALRALDVLAQLGGWRVGVGIGSVQTPVPDDVRAASGDAFVAARAGVEAAKNSATGLCVRGLPDGPVRRTQAALDLLMLTWRRRTPAGWEVARLRERGLAQRDIAAHLGISPSAVSQRLTTAAVEEADAGVALAVWLLDEARSRH